MKQILVGSNESNFWGYKKSTSGCSLKNPYIFFSNIHVLFVLKDIFYFNFFYKFTSSISIIFIWKIFERSLKKLRSLNKYSLIILWSLEAIFFENPIVLGIFILLKIYVFLVLEKIVLKKFTFFFGPMKIEFLNKFGPWNFVFEFFSVNSRHLVP